MKWFFATLAIVFCMSNVVYGEATLHYLQNPDPAPGFASYTIQVTGIGINCLGAFQISGDIHQVWTAPGTQSEWINHYNGNTPGDSMDSYVLFGEERFPDLPNLMKGVISDPPLPTAATIETIYDDSTMGLGTLNNVADAADAYVVYGAPGNFTRTHDLLKLVVPFDEFVTVEVDIYAFDDSSEFPTFYQLALFFGEDALTFLAESASPIPEPSTLALLTLGLVAVVSRRHRRE